MSGIDYEITYLDTALVSGQPEAWGRRYAAFRPVYGRWQLDRAKQLLRLIEGRTIVRQQQGVCAIWRDVFDAPGSSLAERDHDLPAGASDHV